MNEGVIQSEVAAVIQPRVLFKPGSWLAKIDFINHLILFNNVLITILSEKEGGKTSFSTLLQSNLDQQIKSVSMTVKPPCNREDIIQEIASQLHLNHDENTDISSLVAQINERKAHVLLLIDDAQHLPESLIKEAMLAIKNQEDFSFFHLCLISDYSIVATLNNLVASFFENLVHSIELGSLNENETRTYVLQRAMAAHLISKPLTDAQFKQFYQLTKGNVAKINSNLESFIFKCTAQKKKEPRKLIKKVSIAASLAVITGLMGFYFSGNHDFSSFYHFVTRPVQDKGTEALLAKQQVPPQEVLVSQIPSWEDSSTRQLVYAALPKKQSLDDLNDEMSVDTVAIIDKVVVIPKLQMKNLAEQEPRIPESEFKRESPESDLTRESKTVEIPTAKQNKEDRSSSSNTSTPLYTIQVAASHNKKDIERFQQNNKLLAQNAKIRHFTNAKGIWYILTVGEFASRAEAQRNITKLPATLAKLHPWVRPVSNLS
ncbi:MULTISPECIES: SPOR domain-containing protein [Legionella]|uniref:SPOR domain-containing protein n=1 Tax=Legionella resiliens TaxID=2905958 RepID=A0ABS8X4L6_9GAMM|nr:MULTISPECIES: SPOR domain-containing protein [unclassified Legionella]MCE0723119.1 SPOR domain-containing protein [Legionella sp. 9fVS26]MCE3532272.1 SPOR domain-containing protein [Legionella sp. 8cVS16]QLZ68401.1 Cell division protein DamX [Legionella sp. PC1000]